MMKAREMRQMRVNGDGNDDDNMELEVDAEKWKRFTENHGLHLHAGRWQKKEDSNNDCKPDVSPSRCEEVPTNMGTKRPASNDEDQAPAKHMTRIDFPKSGPHSLVGGSQGEKRKIEPNQNASESSKLSKLNSVMSKLNRKDKPFFLGTQQHCKGT